MKHHMQPHVVYISLTNGYKVGVTRDTNIPYRWIDQGAVKAVRLAEVPYRQLAGLIEVSLKSHIADKTHWQKMLKGIVENPMDIIEVRDKMAAHVPDELKQYLTDNPEITQIEYPVLHYPEKVKSMKLDKVPLIEKELMGIKGQYLIFTDGSVLNVRSHAGYRVSIQT
jgi:vacuolar-type H+-ATPase subunit F/Vma7